MDGEPIAGHDQTEFLSWGHGVRCVCPRILQHRAAGSGVSYKTSESDRVGSRGIDFGKVLGTLFDALGFQIGGDGIQDCQQLGSVSGTVEQRGCQVAGHGRMLVCGLAAVFEGAAFPLVQRSASISSRAAVSIVGSIQRAPSGVI